jgi:hypothetical protein
LVTLNKWRRIARSPNRRRIFQMSALLTVDGRFCAYHGCNGESGFDSGDGGGIFEPYTNSFIMLRCSDIVGLSLTPLFPFWGVGSTEQRKGEGGVIVKLAWGIGRATKTFSSQTSTRQVIFWSGQTPSSEVLTNCICCFSVGLIFSLGNDLVW